MSSPVTISASMDNYMGQAGPTSNNGAAAFTRIDTRLTAGSNRRGLVAFDFSALVPAGATITLATLSLYCYTYVAARTITVQRLLRADWSETTSTWNIYKTGSNWTTAGALSDGNDFTSTDAATASLTGTGWLSWSVTNQVKTAFASVGGVAHFTFSESGGADAAVTNWYSRSYAVDPTLRPKLYIEYTVPSAVSPNFIPFFWA